MTAKKPQRIAPSSPFENPGAQIGGDHAPVVQPGRKPLTPEAARHQAELEQRAAEQAPEPSHGTAKRRSRKPFGQVEQRMAYAKRPGFVRRWFNDKQDRIGRAMEAGYEQVIDERTGKPVSIHAGTLENGEGMKAYLLEIPEEFYNEDFAAKQESLNETDKAIYTGTHNQEEGDARYVPRSTPINVRVGTSLR